MIGRRVVQELLRSSPRFNRVFTVCGLSYIIRPALGNQAYVQRERERWMELAELAANEQDPKNLIALVTEINQLLDEKLKRLNGPGLSDPKTS